MRILELKQLTDEQLVARYQTTGDNLYFGEIYTRHYSKVYHTCLNIVKDSDVAMDLTQEVMLKVMEKLPMLKNGFLLGFWLYRIAQNQSIDYCKTQKSNRTICINEGLNKAEDLSELYYLQKKEIYLDSLESNMERLSTADRQLLNQKYFQNMSIVDLGLAYELSESAVKMRLSRAKNRLAVLCRHQPVVFELDLRA